MSTLLDLHARLQEAELRARLAWDAVNILTTRFAKVPEKHRPHFSPAHRFRILEIKNILVWSRERVASVFLLCPNTLSNWERSANPITQTVGALVRPMPPVRRFSDVVWNLTQTMVRLGFGGEDMIAAALARTGWKVSIERPRRARTAPMRP